MDMPLNQIIIKLDHSDTGLIVIRTACKNQLPLQKYL